MNFLSKLNNLLPARTSFSGIQQPSEFLTRIGSQPSLLPGFNAGITLYPYGKDDTYINYGYKKNAAVYSIVSKCAKKFAQVNWYHYKIKRTERKTWAEYLTMTKAGNIRDVKDRIELIKMRKKSVDQTVVNDDLSALISKPNRNQSGTAFRRNLYGHKLLTGEGNQWFSRPLIDGAPDLNQPPQEIFVMPKNNLALIKGSDPWDIAGYELIFNGVPYKQDKSNVLMWIFDTYGLDPYSMSHLRGQAPLEAALLDLQSANEGTERLAIMNKNQGVAAIAFDRSQTKAPTPEQAMFMRRQFNSIVNDRDLAGTVAAMGGDWGAIQLGSNVQQLQIIEQLAASKETLCNVFDVPYTLYKADQTYENKKQAGKEWIYNHIAPASYELRDEWNSTLLKMFDLDRDSDCLDCDILGLPELVDDLQTQATALNTMWFLSPNKKLEYLGFDPDPDPLMEKVYIPNNLVPLDQANSDIGGNLDAQLNSLQ